MKKIYILFLILGISSIIKAQNEKLEKISSYKKVGINTTEPKASLDVNYKVKLNQLGAISKEKGKPLLIDKDGFIVVNKTNNLTFVYFPLDVATINISENESKETLQKAFTIKDFDTKIPTNEYNIIITNGGIDYSAFRENQENKYFGIAVDHSQIDNNNPSNNKDGQAWAPQQVYKAFKKDGTWHISADFEGLPSPYKGATVTAKNKGTFYWHFGILAIKNSYIEEKEVEDDISNNYGVKFYYGDNPENITNYTLRGYYGTYNNNKDDKGPLPE